MEDANKYWKEEKYKLCRFCNEGRDSIEHYVEDCKQVNKWFKNIGNNKDDKLKRLFNDELDTEKGKVLVNLWKEKEKEKCMCKGSV